MKGSPSIRATWNVLRVVWTFHLCIEKMRNHSSTKVETVCFCIIRAALMLYSDDGYRKSDLLTLDSPGFPKPAMSSMKIEFSMHFEKCSVSFFKCAASSYKIHGKKDRNISFQYVLLKVVTLLLHTLSRKLKILRIEPPKKHK